MPTTGRDAAICDAALALLAEVGYDRMSMDAVAARAKASKATIYRKWPGKKELVLEAMQRREEVRWDPPNTGTLRGDFLTGLSKLADQVDTDDSLLIAGCMKAMREAGDLADCMNHQVFDSKKQFFHTIVDRAIARGELPEGAPADLAHEVASALWVKHSVVMGERADEAFLTHVIDEVLIPLLTSVPGSSRTSAPATSKENA